MVMVRMGQQKRGNPNWGKWQAGEMPFQPAVPTQFELVVATFGLKTVREMVRSTRLRKWCYRNRNHRYVPEWLLKMWGMYVDVEN